MKIEITMRYKASTKHTHIYSDNAKFDNTGVLPSLYIKKKALPVNQPLIIKVIIEAL